jgi:selenoprotein W-related protein
VSLAGDLFKHFERQIESLTLVPSDGGRFEVSVNDRLVYSKLQTHRHAEPGEVAGLVQSIIQRGS